MATTTVRLSGASRKMVKLAALYRAYRTAYKGKTEPNFVPGVGDLNARVLIIGELPGVKEVKAKEPFVGNSGLILTKLLRRVDLQREDVWLTNLLKQRPKIGREYFKEEIASLHGLMRMEINIINPDVVITLGRFPALMYFRDAHMPTLAGKAHIKDGRFVVPLYSPAVARFDHDALQEMRKHIMAVSHALKKVK